MSNESTDSGGLEPATVSEVFRASLAELFPRRRVVAKRLGLDREKMSLYLLDDAASPPPAVTATLAKILREKAETLIVAASALEHHA